jgi:hypothetical protein
LTPHITSLADMQPAPMHVCFGSKSDMTLTLLNVR